MFLQVSSYHQPIPQTFVPMNWLLTLSLAYYYIFQNFSLTKLTSDPAVYCFYLVLILFLVILRFTLIQSTQLYHLIVVQLPSFLPLSECGIVGKPVDMMNSISCLSPLCVALSYLTPSDFVLDIYQQQNRVSYYFEVKHC